MHNGIIVIRHPIRVHVHVKHLKVVPDNASYITAENQIKMRSFIFMTVCVVYFKPLEFNNIVLINF